MALGPRLELRQGQSLVITPQLQQAIKLLQLTNLELEAYVEAELERNPLLQRDERDSDPEPEPVKAETPTADYSVDSVPDSAAHADMDAGPTCPPASATAATAARARARPAARSTGRGPAAAAPSRAMTTWRGGSPGPRP